MLVDLGKDIIVPESITGLSFSNDLLPAGVHVAEGDNYLHIFWEVFDPVTSTFYLFDSDGDEDSAAFVICAYELNLDKLGYSGA